MNNNNFFSIESEITNGLNEASHERFGGIVSIGKIVLEKNNKKDEADIAANIDVSSDLNAYPNNIPSKMKVEDIINSAAITVIITKASSFFRKNAAWPKIIAS